MGQDNFGDLTTEQLQQAVRLLVRPEWLRERAVLAAKGPFVIETTPEDGV